MYISHFGNNILLTLCFVLMLRLLTIFFIEIYSYKHGKRLSYNLASKRNEPIDFLDHEFDKHKAYHANRQCVRLSFQVAECRFHRSTGLGYCTDEVIYVLLIKNVRLSLIVDQYICKTKNKKKTRLSNVNANLSLSYSNLLKWTIIFISYFNMVALTV